MKKSLIILFLSILLLVLVLASYLVFSNSSIDSDKAELEKIKADLTYINVTQVEEYVKTINSFNIYTPGKENRTVEEEMEKRKAEADNLRIFQIIPFSKDEKSIAMEQYCQKVPCEDITIVSVKSLGNDVCQGLLIIKVNGRWVYIDDNNLEDSYCT